MGFSRQEYWSGLPFRSPGDLPDPGIEPGSPALQADALTSEPPRKPLGFPRSLSKLSNWEVVFRFPVSTPTHVRTPPPCILHVQSSQHHASEWCIYNKWLAYINTLSPKVKFTSEFTFGAVHSVDFGKQIMACIHYYSTTQNISLPSNHPSGLRISSIPPLNSWQPVIFLLSP